MDCREKIMSEDFADFIVEINTDDSQAKEKYGDDCILFTSVNYGVIFKELSSSADFVSAPDISVMDGKRLIEYNYAEIPKLYALMDAAAIEDTGAIKLQNYPGLELNGNGIIIGFIGDGIDVYHEAFRYSNGNSRVIAAWDQTNQDYAPPFDFVYGSFLSNEIINSELRKNYSMALESLSYGSSHGTFMAGIAAGNIGIENGFSSVAPQADLAVVKLKPAKRYLRRYYYVRDDAEVYQENDILTGINFLSRLAILLGKPIVICIATGTSFGAHNGLGVVGDLINSIGIRPGVGICVANGNEGNSRHHFLGKISSEGSYEDVEIRVEENIAGLSVEMWGESPDVFSLEIISPTGERIPKIAIGISGNNEFEFLFQRTKIYIKYEVVESRSGAQVIEIKMEAPTAGIWTFRIYGEIVLNGIFNIWLPVTEMIGNNTYFLRPDPYTTLTIPADTYIPLSVGAYNDESGGIFIESGRGNPTNMTIKPCLVAPGVNIYGTDINNTYTQRSGTSISAAITAGVMAQFMEWGILRGTSINMSTIDIKNYLIRGARRRPTITYPDREWGYGILDAYNSLDILRS